MKQVTEKISLIVATVGRAGEVRRLLDSIKDQNDTNLEIIIIDQNDDDRLIPVVDAASNHLDIKHLRSERGLSRARNVGLLEASGDIIAFPDDDCWYPPETLSTVRSYFSQSGELDGLTGRAASETGAQVGGHWLPNPGPVTKSRVWKQAISYTIFLRRPIINCIGNFDVDLGVGSNGKWMSGEETDYLLRAIANGFNIYYYPAIVIHHPMRDENKTYADLGRTRGYARGMGYVMRKHRYSLLSLASYTIRSLLGSVIAILLLNPRKAQVRWARAVGRWEGWFGCET